MRSNVIASKSVKYIEQFRRQRVGERNLAAQAKRCYCCGSSALKSLGGPPLRHALPSHCGRHDGGASGRRACTAPAAVIACCRSRFSNAVCGTSGDVPCGHCPESAGSFHSTSAVGATACRPTGGAPSTARHARTDAPGAAPPSSHGAARHRPSYADANAQPRSGGVGAPLAGLALGWPSAQPHRCAAARDGTRRSGDGQLTPHGVTADTSPSSIVRPSFGGPKPKWQSAGPYSSSQPSTRAMPPDASG
mmetsp:Transcript_5992/g.18467  ORF Transcript_5992/g.18467 Transcript_5992/m.18467 type:complete len:249 (-) Transcript_5992:1692-2438(-)